MIDYSLANKNTDKFTDHNYQLIYKNFLNHNLKNILEIGSARGGFAKFLKENSFNSFLVGADLKFDHTEHLTPDLTNYNNFYNDFFEGDCFSETFLNWINTKNYRFDLVVEDAQHTIDQQIFMIDNCEKLLNPNNSVYICEDLQGYNNAKEVIKYVPYNLKKYAYIWDASECTGRADDICIIIDTR
jgi:hypothetical protein